MLFPAYFDMAQSSQLYGNIRTERTRDRTALVEKNTFICVKEKAGVEAGPYSLLSLMVLLL